MRHRLFLALVLTASLQPLAAQTIQVNKDNKTIAITATDSAETEADTADITIGFTAYGTDEQKTYADATVTSNRIVAALTAAGIPRDHIRSTSQNLSRIDNGDKRYAEGIRFTFSQSWRVTTKAADASNVLHMAVLAGANNSGNISWRLTDDNALEAEAARKALAHAQQIAERMASGLHAKLGSLVYASNEMPQREYGSYRVVAGVMGGSGTGPASVNLKPLAIMPDKVTRSATVYAVFALE